MNVRNAGKATGTAALSDSAFVPPGRQNLPDRNQIIATDSETHCSAFTGDLLGFGLSCCSSAAGAADRWRARSVFSNGESRESRARPLGACTALTFILHLQPPNLFWWSILPAVDDVAETSPYKAEQLLFPRNRKSVCLCACVLVCVCVCKLEFFLFIFYEILAAEERKLKEIESLAGRAFLKKLSSQTSSSSLRVLFLLLSPSLSSLPGDRQHRL